MFGGYCCVVVIFVCKFGFVQVEFVDGVWWDVVQCVVEYMCLCVWKWYVDVGFVVCVCWYVGGGGIGGVFGRIIQIEYGLYVGMGVGFVDQWMWQWFVGDVDDIYVWQMFCFQDCIEC